VVGKRDGFVGVESISGRRVIVPIVESTPHFKHAQPQLMLDQLQMPSVTDHKLTNGARMQGDAEILEQIDAARIDGRARNVLYRMKQLHAMHSFMLTKRQELVQALQKGI